MFPLNPDQLVGSQARRIFSECSIHLSSKCNAPLNDRINRFASNERLVQSKTDTLIKKRNICSVFLYNTYVKCLVQLKPVRFVRPQMNNETVIKQVENLGKSMGKEIKMCVRCACVQQGSVNLCLYGS